jgi:putative tryptophan/tyrosine transport system substrate-binding protein
MRRRTFIAGLGATAAWPLAARGQQARMRRLGWLLDRDEGDRQVEAFRTMMREELAKLGWIEGQNLLIDVHFGARDLSRIDEAAAQLVGLAPDVIITNGGFAIRALQERTRTIPIIFTAGPDPLEAGLVRNIAKPEGNLTGFPTFEPTIIGRWLELLKEAVPRLARVGVIIHPQTAAANMKYIQAAAAAFGVEAIGTPVHSSVDTVRAIDAFAATPDGGLVVMSPPPAIGIRDAILELAAQHRLPIINGYRELAAAGALMSYGSVPGDLFRGGAFYVDRLLRGTKVSELPVQFPTKYQLVVNLKAAKAIGLTVPEAFLLRADELIE